MRPNSRNALEGTQLVSTDWKWVGSPDAYPLSADSGNSDVESFEVQDEVDTESAVKHVGESAVATTQLAELRQED